MLVSEKQIIQTFKHSRILTRKCQVNSYVLTNFNPCIKNTHTDNPVVKVQEFRYKM